MGVRPREHLNPRERGCSGAPGPGMREAGNFNKKMAPRGGLEGRVRWDSVQSWSWALLLRTAHLSLIGRVVVIHSALAFFHSYNLHFILVSHPEQFLRYAAFAASHNPCLAFTSS